LQMEQLLLIVMWLSGFTGMILFIPNNERRKGILAFMVFQSFIWLCDMPAFSFHLLSAPVREFPKATDLALTINYFFYPVLFSIYYVNKRKKNGLLSKITYFLVWVSTLTMYDVILERYTDLLEYGYIRWYGMWIYIGFLFFVSQACCNWFFKEKIQIQSERWKNK